MQTLHLMVTERCPYKCPLCCNLQYPTEQIPIATAEDLNSSEILCITGGEPLDPEMENPLFDFLVPTLKEEYSIKKVYVYTTGRYLGRLHSLGKCTDRITVNFFRWKPEINGLSIGPKSKMDWVGLESLAKEHAYLRVLEPSRKPILPTENRLYVFPEWETTFASLIERYPAFTEDLSVEVIHREWQTDFKPDPNSIFRRLDPLL